MQLDIRWVMVLALLLGCRQEPVEEIHFTAGAGVKAVQPIAIPTNSWPWWRGQQRDSIEHQDIVPFDWKTQPHVGWSAKIQGLGHSSPIVVGDKVLITTADERQETKSLVCYEAESGKSLWTTVVHQGGFMRTHQKNSQASATPATDGKYVFTAFIVKDSLYVSAIDLKGQIVWQKEAGPFRSQHGYGSSPLVYGSYVIVLADSNGPGFLAALNRDSGDIVWRVSRANDPSYSTPTLGDIAGKKQLIVGGTGKVTSYNPDDGAIYWFADGPAKTIANTPAIAGDIVICTGGFPQNGAIAIRADGSGDVTDTHVLWTARERIYVPSPIVIDNKLYAVNDEGIGLCYDTQTGKRLSRARIGGKFSASLTQYGGQMLVPDEDGTMRVFDANPRFDDVAQFQLEGMGFASPVFAEGKLYWRTSTHLYCLEPAAPSS
ncbi:PQQ-binding-like beta-propeller repeat protein [bacterium]|nr:PQQ-binding-like beta-propeller repeat protein [bacterium]